MFTSNTHFKDFQNKRMKIFGEIVKQYWNGNLNTAEDLENLSYLIKEKYDFSDEDIPFIRDHIRIAMGLDPAGDMEFGNELDIVSKSEATGAPVIAKINGICKDCGDNTCKDLCKHEAGIYRRNEGPVIDNNQCISCGECVVRCDFGALADKIQFIPLVNLLKDKNVAVFAAVAPAITGQFGDAQGSLFPWPS